MAPPQTSNLPFKSSFLEHFRLRRGYYDLVMPDDKMVAIITSELYSAPALMLLIQDLHTAVEARVQPAAAAIYSFRRQFFLLVTSLAMQGVLKRHVNLRRQLQHITLTPGAWLKMARRRQLTG